MPAPNVQYGLSEIPAVQPELAWAKALAELQRLEGVRAAYQDKATELYQQAFDRQAEGFGAAHYERPANVKQAFAAIADLRTEHRAAAKLVHYLTLDALPKARVAELETHIAERRATAATLYQQALDARADLKRRMAAGLAPGEDVTIDFSGHPSEQLLKRSLLIDGGLEINGTKTRSEVDQLNEELFRAKEALRENLRHADQVGLYNPFN